MLRYTILSEVGAADFFFFVFFSFTFYFYRNYKEFAILVFLIYIKSCIIAVG